MPREAQWNTTTPAPAEDPSMDDEHVRQLEEGMRLLSEYAQKVAGERGHKVSVRWGFRGPLRDGPSKFTMTMELGGKTQDADFPREPIEDYPGGVGVGRAEATVKAALQILINGLKERPAK